MTAGSTASRGDSARHAIGYRLRQARHHASTGNQAVNLPAHLASLLSPDAARRFQTLRPGDQQHLIAVADTLAGQGASDDLVTAGLLHDIGKARPGTAIRLGDRAAKVVLNAVAPELLTRWASRSRPPRFGTGLWVLARHAEAGATFAGESGSNGRVQWLIAHHERRDLNDTELQRLIAADDGSDGCSTR